MINAETFTPPFCPESSCRLHNPENIREGKSSSGRRGNRWYIKKGIRFLASGKEVQMYCCKVCNTGFSSRTFSIDYYAKKQLDYRRLLVMAVSCMGIRAMSRALHCSMGTVQNKLDRLSRQAAALKSIITPMIELKEDLCADGFESFTCSQYHPNNFNILVGVDSQYTYFVNYAQLRRKGAMTDGQKQVAAYLKKTIPAEPYQIQHRFSELVDQVVNLQQRSKKKRLIVHTDKKKEYEAPLAFVAYGGVDPSLGYRIEHHQTSSRIKRDRANPLFPVNYMDREFRKDLAEHVRESTRFGRNVSNAVGRMELYLFHHNHFKAYRINVSQCTYETHAEAAGLSMDEVNRLVWRWLHVRHFRSHLEFDMHLGKVWGKGYGTPGKWKMDYVPEYIYQ
jgi:transposase-like protein